MTKQKELDSDEILVQQARDGDARAARDLTRRYASSLTSFFRNKVPDSMVPDLVQQTLISSVGALARFDGRCSFRHYVFSIAKRVAWTEHRRPAKPFTKAATMIPIDDIDFAHEPNDEVEFNQTTTIINDAINELPEHYSMAVQLYIGGYDDFEAANVQGINYNTARSRLSRGLSKIRKKLGGSMLAFGRSF